MLNPINKEDRMAEGASKETETVEFTGEFDAERAAKALAASRQDTKDAKEKSSTAISQLEKDLAAYRKVEQDQADADKASEVKLAEAEATIKRLETVALDRMVQDDFLQKAVARGYADPSLAYAAALAQGALGQYAKDGSVGDHDFEALEASHSTFATEAGAQGRQSTGDAAAKSGGNAKTEAERFNEEIRSQF